MKSEEKNEKLRKLPKIDELLLQEVIVSAKGLPHSLLLEAARQVIFDLRTAILEGDMQADTQMEKVACLVLEKAEYLNLRSLRKVINATGIILHTNLGRARLNRRIWGNVTGIAENYSNLEYDIALGKRGSRHQHVSQLIAKITGSEAAMVVNNNAAAVMLCLSTLAKGKEVIVSRGELVEIGGAFRVPDIMEQSGGTLLEVGTTNKTKRSDYERAMNAEMTGALLKVHTSNYRIIGFTEETPLTDLVTLGNHAGIPVIYDLGSGLLFDLKGYGVDEPTVQSGIADGADVVLFSGDKLLGGPQAGIIIGKKRYIEAMKKNPLARVVRSDKLTLAALEETFRIYMDGGETAAREIPVLSMIMATRETLLEKAEKLKAGIAEKQEFCEARIENDNSQIGGGSAPMLDLPTVVVSLSPTCMSVGDLEKSLRMSPTSIVARIAKDKVLLDMRTVADDELSVVIETLLAIFS